MANVLNYEAQIGTGQVIQPWHISQSVDAFTGAEAYDITISGSLVTTGSIKGTTTLTIGSNHTNTGTLSTIAGGLNSTVEDSNDSILGGQSNQIINGINVFGNIGHNSIIGGCNNKIDGTRGFNFIAGGYNNIISGSVCGYHSYANIILGRSSIINACDRNSISGGGSNIISGSISNSNIAGGVSNRITGQTSTIGGGASNCVLAGCSIIAGGENNSISNGCSTISGGCLNTITSACSGILGGFSNTVAHADSFIIGSNLTSDKACTTFMNNVHITGSTTANGILQLSRRDTTPSGVEGMVIASGSAGDSKLYYFNGSTWNALF